MLLSMGIPAVVFFILLMFVVKSPRWLVKEGRIDEAKAVLTSLNEVNDTDEMIREISKTLEGGSSVGIIAMLKKENFKLIIIGIVVGMFNQFTGINVIMYYATDIFRSAGFTTNLALGQTVIIGVVNLMFTLIAMRLIDRIGRKRLLLTGTLGMSAFLALFAFAYINGSLPGWVLMASLVGFIAFFASSQGAVIWVLLAEIYPNHLRSMGTSMGSFSHWFFNGLITFLYPIVIGLFSSGKGTGYIFIFYAAATFISYFVFRKYLVEMKGKTLESHAK